ncbi:hypothetical protein [Rhizobium leguminosarum]|uniref:hypothetical protein n=1 Tax=Rhizobium leguminosarum TaxID=384 RepID=UPI0015585DED|nr:hypothetical protein [Rhizobium leguminosarum]
MLELYAPQGEAFARLLCRQAERDKSFEKPSLPRDDGVTILNVSHDHLKFGLICTHPLDYQSSIIGTDLSISLV